MAPRKKEMPVPVQGNLTEVLGIKLSNPPMPEEPDEGVAKPDFFGAIQNYFTKREPVTTATSSSEVFIQARFLSMCEAGFDAAALYNEFSGKLPKWARAVVLYWLTPARDRAPRMNYIKADKGKESDAYKEVVQRITGFFKCRPHHAPQIYDLLEAQKFDIYAFFGLKTPRGFLGATGKEDDNGNGKAEQVKRKPRTGATAGPAAGGESSDRPGVPVRRRAGPAGAVDRVVEPGAFARRR